MLLLVLAGVVWGQWLERSELRAWDHSLRVVIYPINGDGSAASDRFIQGLRERSFDPLEDYIEQQAAAYGLRLVQPIDFVLGGALSESPPPPPRGGNIFQIMWWNFQSRRWAANITEGGPPGDIRAFVQYYDHQGEMSLAHSVGVEKGRLAIVNLFATRAMTAENNMVLLHEVLHTLGASDKYDYASNQPLFPQGYADPQQKPLFPQRNAEVMAGRIALSQTQTESIKSLGQLVIGQETAAEIGWLNTP